MPLIAMWPEYKVVYPPIGGTGGGGGGGKESDSHIEVILVKVRVFRMESHYITCIAYRVVHKEIYKKSRDTNHRERYQGV